MEFFYASPDNVAGNTLTIDGEEFSHLTHVMRKKQGDLFCVVDGIGNAYDVTLASISKRSAICEIHARHPRLHESPVSITLGVGMLKNHSSFDFLVEKCTELGVTSIVPLLTERTIPKHDKAERWQKLALAAMKQSGRCVLPRVSSATPLQQFLESAAPSDLKYIPHEKTTSPEMIESLQQRQHASSVVLCIGPEGGFSDGEIEHASRSGFIPVSLGVRRLRTETAAIAASSLIAYLR